MDNQERTKKFIAVAVSGIGGFLGLLSGAGSLNYGVENSSGLYLIAGIVGMIASVYAAFCLFKYMKKLMKISNP